MLVPAVCVLVIVSEKRGRTKANVEENHYNEQLVEGTVFVFKGVRCSLLKFIHLIYFREVFFCHHR